MAKLEFTNAAFVRSHGRNPSGRGSWAFQETVDWSAFDRDLRGDVWFAPGSCTLTEAKKAAREHFAGCEGILAVLP